MLTVCAHRFSETANQCALLPEDSRNHRSQPRVQPQSAIMSQGKLLLDPDRQSRRHQVALPMRSAEPAGALRLAAGLWFQVGLRLSPGSPTAHRFLTESCSSGPRFAQCISLTAVHQLFLADVPAGLQLARGNDVPGAPRRSHRGFDVQPGLIRTGRGRPGVAHLRPPRTPRRTRGELHRASYQGHHAAEWPGISAQNLLSRITEPAGRRAAVSPATRTCHESGPRTMPARTTRQLTTS